MYAEYFNIDRIALKKIAASRVVFPLKNRLLCVLLNSLTLHSIIVFVRVKG